MLDPGPPGGEQAASFGNGAWLSPSSVVPVAMPGLWRKVPGYLMDATGPLTIRAAALPGLATWLLRFVAAGATVPQVERTSRALRALVGDGPARHRALAAEAGVPELIGQRGLLYVYPDRAAFAQDSLAWRLRRDTGVTWHELDSDALRQQEPSLARQYQFGVLVPDGGHCNDPGGYVAALMAHAVGLGAELIKQAATGFDGRSTLHAVRTAAGPIPCDAAVIAAGARAGPLAAALGNRVPLRSERGYHVTIDPGTAAMPRLPLMPSDGKMSVTLLEQDGQPRLRVAGQVELAHIDAPPDWRRAAILRDWAQRLFPTLATDSPTQRWMGHRPSIADGLPVIGLARRCDQVAFAFGHGHVGLSAGPMTGRLVADLLGGHSPVIDPAPYAPQRFELLPRRVGRSM